MSEFNFNKWAQSKISYDTWDSNYRAPGEETPEDSWKREAKACASVEKEEIREQVEQDFLWLLDDFKGNPGGRISANLGVEGREATTLLNCFFNGPNKYLKNPADSLAGIFEQLDTQAQTLKSEGGYGTNFSYIRPSGSYVDGIGGRTPGVLKFMELWDKSSEIITMGSEKVIGGRKKGEKKKIRKGAQMSVLSCISGDSLISTVNGKVAIKELVGKNPLVYCTDCKGNVFVRKANKVWSNGVKKVVKVKFDNDDFIICTPDHLILKKDGTYVKAEELKFGDSLSVLHKRLYNKYYTLSVTGFRKTVGEHIAVAEMKYGRYPIVKIKDNGCGFASDSEDVHHIDFNTLNNNEDNLEILTKVEHNAKHKDRNCEILDRVRKSSYENKVGKTFVEFYGEEKAAEIYKKASSSRMGKTPWNKGLVGEDYKNHYNDGFKNQFSEKLADKTNHKVISVEFFGEQEVFDMSVPDYHNFVANGIFVHNCFHPETPEYIDAKLTPNRLTKFNLSVGVIDGFMDAVNNDADWDLVFPDTSFEKYNSEWDGDISSWKEKGYPIVVHETVKARDLWEKIMKATYARNDPGVIYLDLANKLSPINYIEKIQGSNPCSEILLSAPGVCLLFSLNLVKFVTKNALTNKFEFDFETFRKAVSIAVRFSDNINDITRTPLPEYKDTLLEKRRIGVGVLALGSLLFMLGMKYGSKESQDLVKNIFKVKCEEELLASAKLGKEKGSFPLFDREKFFNTYYWKTLQISPEVKKQIEEIGEMRNSHRSANAPTGNMSITAGCVSGGIEPVFLKEYTRWVTVVDSERIALKEQGFEFPNPLLGEWFETSILKTQLAGKDEILRGTFNGVQYQVDKSRGLTKAELIQDYGWKFVKENYSQEEIKHFESEGVFATTEELTVHEHLELLKVIAQYTDQHSSKTVNLPNDYPYEDFKNLYMDAWKSGIKGITTYRAGTMMAVLESTASTQKDEVEVVSKAVDISRERPKKLQSETHKVKIEAGDEVKNAYVTISFADQKQPYEVFINTPVGDNLKDTQILELTSRLSSLAMRNDVPLEDIIDQLQKVDGQFIYSIPNTLSKVLNEYVHVEEGSVHSVCPSCGEKTYVKKDGCTLCLSCSYSACS